MDLNDENSFVLTKKECQFMNKLEENLKCLSLRQQRRTKQDWEPWEAMINLTVDGLKATIWMNLINNNMVTTYDLILATKYYGLNVG